EHPGISVAGQGLGTATSQEALRDELPTKKEARVKYKGRGPGNRATAERTRTSILTLHRRRDRRRALNALGFHVPVVLAHFVAQEGDRSPDGQQRDEHHDRIDVRL